MSTAHRYSACLVLAGVLLLHTLSTHVDAWNSHRPWSIPTRAEYCRRATQLTAENLARKGGDSRRSFLMHVAAAAFVPPAFASDCVCAAEVVEEIINTQQKNLIEDLKKEEKKEKTEEKDKGKLIAGLEKATDKPEASKPPPPPAKVEAKPAPPAPKPSTSSATTSAQKSELAKASKLIDAETQQLIDQLEAEEEEIEEETVQLMAKVEALEATAERLNKPLLPEPDAKTSDEAVTKSQTETMEFLDKLKKRSKQKEEFIDLLKKESKAFASGNKADMKLNDFLASLKRTSDDDKEFGVALNSFREKLQSRFSK